jgi:hypothetical protein
MRVARRLIKVAVIAVTGAAGIACVGELPCNDSAGIGVVAPHPTIKSAESVPARAWQGVVGRTSELKLECHKRQSDLRWRAFRRGAGTVRARAMRVPVRVPS